MSSPVTTAIESDQVPPRRARWFVRSTLERWGLTDLVGDAELLVDELVSNAMTHAHGTGVDVTVRMIDDVVRIEVGDPDPNFEIDFRDSAQGPSRFGLRIVDTLASSWGVESAAIGKVVWCELDSRSQGGPEALDTLPPGR